MGRVSNSLVGTINFLTFLISIPILGGGIWLSTKSNSTDRLRRLQHGRVSRWFHRSLLPTHLAVRLYLVAMFVIVIALIGFTIFALPATAQGYGRAVLNRNYLEYRLSDYSGWLKDRVPKTPTGSRSCRASGMPEFYAKSSPEASRSPPMHSSLDPSPPLRK